MIETSKLLLVELIVFKYNISTKSQRHLRFEAEYFFCSFSNTHLGSPPSIMAYIVFFFLKKNNSYIIWLKNKISYCSIHYPYLFILAIDHKQAV
jgi:hypothetical protein